MEKVRATAIFIRFLNDDRAGRDNVTTMGQSSKLVLYGGRRNQEQFYKSSSMRTS